MVRRYGGIISCYHIFAASQSNEISGIFRQRVHLWFYLNPSFLIFISVYSVPP